jgi:hypothetical protein
MKELAVVCREADWAELGREAYDFVPFTRKGVTSAFHVAHKSVKPK